MSAWRNKKDIKPALTPSCELTWQRTLPTSILERSSHKVSAN
jgi:hypothetical protein